MDYVQIKFKAIAFGKSRQKSQTWEQWLRIAIADKSIKDRKRGKLTSLSIRNSNLLLHLRSKSHPPLNLAYESGGDHGSSVSPNVSPVNLN
jgi:hypothetical protein